MDLSHHPPLFTPGSSDSVDIRQRPECLATRVELFDFVNLVACAASALQQDNQLLLLLQERVVELQQVDSSQHIRQEREEWAQRERETQTRRVKEVVKRYCEQFGEEDAIAFLVVGVEWVSERSENDGR